MSNTDTHAPDSSRFTGAVLADNVERDEGTIVVFSGVEVDGETAEPTGRSVHFACEHRMAGPISEAIAAGEEPICAVPEVQP